MAGNAALWAGGGDLLRAEALLAANQLPRGLALLEPWLRAPPPGATRSQQADAQRLGAIACLMQTPPDTELALARAQAASALMPDDARNAFVRGRALKAAGELPAAIDAYRHALRLNPRHAQAQVSLGIALRHHGDLEGAVAAQEAAVSLEPQLAAAHAGLASARAALAERHAQQAAAEATVPDADAGAIDAAAIDSAARAAALDPRNPLLHRNHGLLLQRARRRLEATAAFNLALGAAPADVELCLRLGHLLKSLGHTAQVIALYERWLAHGGNAAAPGATPVMRALASALTREGQVDQALPWALKAAAIDPDPWALVQLCSVYQQCRRHDEAIAAGRRAVALSGGHPEIQPVLLMGLNYAVEDPQVLHDAQAALAARFTADGRGGGPGPFRPRTASPPRKLRVGYVSGDFVRHSVSYFIGPLLQHHDRDRFEVTCYHNLAWGDAVTERFKALGHRWVECEADSDAELARRIAHDGIDILIDLSGHTTHARTRLFAQRAAPLQIAYLGYPTRCGVPAIDRRITDAVIDPGDQPSSDWERPLVLPRSMYCYRPEAAPDLLPPPLLQQGHITFGSFNNIAKLSDHTLRLWAQVMQAVPGSKLLLKSSAMAQATNRAGIEAFMAGEGIAAGRLSLQAWSASKTDHLALYRQVDIALDTFPYNGATTTCEALWMGVPVVSRRGRTHAARMGASILGAIGESGWVAGSDAEFVGIGQRLASDGAGLARWRQQARSQLRGSALMDETGFVRSFERALQAAWA